MLKSEARECHKGFSFLVCPFLKTSGTHERDIVSEDE